METETPSMGPSYEAVVKEMERIQGKPIHLIDARLTGQQMQAFVSKNFPGQQPDATRVAQMYLDTVVNVSH